MPLYGFICQDCKDEFEELVLSSSQTEEVACPECKSENVSRTLSLVAALSRTGSSSASASSAACAPSG